MVSGSGIIPAFHGLRRSPGWGRSSGCSRAKSKDDSPDGWETAFRHFGMKHPTPTHKAGGLQVRNPHQNPLHHRPKVKLADSLCSSLFPLWPALRTSKSKPMEPIHPDHPSRIAPGNASGTLPERGVSVESFDSCQRLKTADIKRIARARS